MKKANVLKILCGVSILAVFVSCQPTSGNPNEKRTAVDLRNYDAEGNVYRSASEGQIEFFSEITNDYANFYRDDSLGEGHNYFWNEDCPDWVLKSVTIEDCDDGIRVIYHRPKGIENFSDKPIGWFSVTYIDGNGNNSTSTSISYDKMNDCYDAAGNWDLKIRDTFYVDYPLVLPGNETYINVQYGYNRGSGTKKDFDALEQEQNGNSDNQFFLSFKVIPAHGKACIKDLPAKFVSLGELGAGSANYVKLSNTSDGLILSGKDIIPPEGKNIRRSYSVVEADSNDKYFGNNFNNVGWVDEAVENPEKDFDVNLIKFKVDNENNCGLSNSMNKPYIFCETQYSYELDEYPGLIFHTPLLKTPIIKSDKLYRFKSNKEAIDFLVSYGYMKEVNSTTYELSAKTFNSAIDYFRPRTNKASETDADYTFIITDENPDLNLLGKPDIQVNYILDLSKTKIKKIKEYGFGSANIKNVTGVILPNTLEVIGMQALDGTSISNLVIPSSVKAIGACVTPWNTVDGITVDLTFEDSDNWYFARADEGFFRDGNYYDCNWEKADFKTYSYKQHQNINDIWVRYYKMNDKEYEEYFTYSAEKYIKKVSESTYEFSIEKADIASKYLDSTKDYTFVITDENPSVWSGQWKAFKSFTGKISFDLSKTKLKEISSWGLFNKFADSAVDNYSNIVSVILPETVEEIGDSTFSATSITTLLIPAKTTRVGGCIVPDGATVEFADKTNWYRCVENDDEKPWNNKDYTSSLWTAADLDKDPYPNDWHRYAKIEK